MTETTDAPLAPEAAREQIAARIADPQFTKRYLSGEQGAVDEFRALHAAGHPSPEQAKTVEDVERQAAARDAEMMEGRIAALSRVADLTPQMQEEIRRQQPISADEQNWARQQIDRMKRDRAFVRRLFDGDREAGTEWTRMHQLISLPRSTSNTTYPVTK